MTMNAWLTFGMGCHIFGEHAEAAARQTDSAVGVPTGASTRYFAEPSFKSR
jgi:hypothetical protein